MDKAMSEMSYDHPQVIIFPPAILAGTIALACAMQWISPLGVIANASQMARLPIGGLFILAGVALASAGRRALTRLGTNVSPLRPTTALATDGVYKRTRNPLYIGGTLVMLGLAVLFALDWLLLLIVPSVLVLHFGVVRIEERYLERKFGETYHRYKMSVARYGLGF